MMAPSEMLDATGQRVWSLADGTPDADHDCYASTPRCIAR